MTLLPAIAAIVRRVPEVEPLLSAAARRALKQAGGYEPIRNEYRSRCFDAVYSYMQGGSMVASRNAMTRAMLEAFTDAVHIGYEDGGGELPMDDESEKWLTARQNQEMGYIHDLFATLRDSAAEPMAEATARADGYSASLDALYSEAQLRGGRNKMVTWRLGATEKHCSTCSKLNGQRHRMIWFVSKGYIPRQPGSETLECGGYNCDCFLEDDQGNVVTMESE